MATAIASTYVHHYGDARLKSNERIGHSLSKALRFHLLSSLKHLLHRLQKHPAAMPNRNAVLV
jgi:hypothetical protein